MAKGYALDQAAIAVIKRVVNEVLGRRRSTPEKRAGHRFNERLGVRRYKLLSNLDQSSGTAVFMFRDEESGELVPDDEANGFVLYNAFGIFRGTTGQYGYCVPMVDGPELRWEVLQAECGS